LRWYVEGNTEFYGIQSVLGRYSPIDLVNLRGNVVAKGGKGVAFRESLQSDLQSNIFSFVSLDGDVADYIRVIRKAAEKDEICGMFFISEPDFEFANFKPEELLEIIWKLALENGAAPNEHEQLAEAVRGAKSGKEFIKFAGQALPSLHQVDKGKIWGEMLIKYAWDKQEISSTEGNKVIRPIVNAVSFAIRTVSTDYHMTRNYFKVDPRTGQPIKRNL
jgi:hypothetical protein